MIHYDKNTYTDVAWLISWWDLIYFEQHSSVVRSWDWRINHHGEVHNFDGTIFSKNHPLFLESIEIWVRDLVVILIQKFNCITYNSCQWHKNSPKRRVGILPRDQQEYAHIYEQLTHFVRQKYSKYWLCWTIDILKTELCDSKSGLYFPVIDVIIDSYSIFKFFPFSWHQKIIDTLTAELIEHIHS